MEEFLDSEFVEVQENSAPSPGVVLEENISFYRAILAIQHQDYDRALSIISRTREELSSSISSLLSESFSRAYRAMVAMQVRGADLIIVKLAIEYSYEKNWYVYGLSSFQHRKVATNIIIIFVFIARKYFKSFLTLFLFKVLAELEEVVDYKQLVKATTELEAVKNTAMTTGDTLAFSNGADSQRGYAGSGSGAVPGLGSDHNTAADLTAKKGTLLRKWKGRLKWVPKEVDVHRQILVIGLLWKYNHSK